MEYAEKYLVDQLVEKDKKIEELKEKLKEAEGRKMTAELARHLMREVVDDVAKALKGTKIVYNESCHDLDRIEFHSFYRDDHEEDFMHLESFIKVFVDKVYDEETDEAIKKNEEENNADG